MRTPIPLLLSLLAFAPFSVPQTAQIREAQAPLPGVRLGYLDSGGIGIPVVFLHAATGSSRAWEYQIPAFTAAGYRFIAFDRRGYGRTIIDPSGPQPGTAADDLENLVKFLGIDRFHLVGTAAGGFGALDYALSYPARLRSLVVANSIGGVTDADYLNLGRTLRPSPQFDALPPEIREVGPSYRAANPKGTERWVELERISRAPGERFPPQPLRNRITFAMLEKITTPTFFLTGAADLYAPPPLLKRFTDRVGNSRSTVIPEAGHSSYWENPELFNYMVLEFIRTH